MVSPCSCGHRIWHEACFMASNWSTVGCHPTMRARSITLPCNQGGILGATLVAVSTAPLLLVLRPTLDPVLGSCIAIVHVGHCWTIVSAPLAMFLAAPLLF